MTLSFQSITKYSRHETQGHRCVFRCDHNWFRSYLSERTQIVRAKQYDVYQYWTPLNHLNVYCTMHYTSSYVLRPKNGFKIMKFLMGRSIWLQTFFLSPLRLPKRESRGVQFCNSDYFFSISNVYYRRSYQLLSLLLSHNRCLESFVLSHLSSADIIATLE